MDCYGSGIHGILFRMWRDARVVEWAGLENRYARKRIEGSNPSLSASLQRSNFLGVIFQIIKPPFEPQYS